MATKGIIYYTDNRMDVKTAEIVRKQLLEATDLSIVSVSLEPLDFGKNIVLREQRGYLTMFKQILIALEESTADVIFHCEHDCLYPPEHFEFTPPRKDVFYYNHNWCKVGKGDLAVHWDADQVSGLCAYRKTLIDFYKKRIAEFDPDNFDRKFEPMSGEKSEAWKSPVPYIDIRGDWNLTYSKWSLDDFRKKDTAVNFETLTVDQIPGWDLSGIL